MKTPSVSTPSVKLPKVNVPNVKTAPAMLSQTITSFTGSGVLGGQGAGSVRDPALKSVYSETSSIYDKVSSQSESINHETKYEPSGDLDLPRNVRELYLLAGFDELLRKTTDLDKDTINKAGNDMARTMFDIAEAIAAAFMP